MVRCELRAAHAMVCLRERVCRLRRGRLLEPAPSRGLLVLCRDRRTEWRRVGDWAGLAAGAWSCWLSESSEGAELPGDDNSVMVGLAEELGWGLCGRAAATDLRDTGVLSTDSGLGPRDCWDVLSPERGVLSLERGLGPVERLLIARSGLVPNDLRCCALTKAFDKDWLFLLDEPASQ